MKLSCVIQPNWCDYF